MVEDNYNVELLMFGSDMTSQSIPFKLRSDPLGFSTS